MPNAQIVKWIEDKGYGFARIDGNHRDIFVHITAFGRIPRSPHVGESFEALEIKEENGKRKITRASIPGLSPIPGPRRFSRRMSLKTWLFLVLAFIVLAIFGKQCNGSPMLPSALVPSMESPTNTFRCEGKTYCNQMGSKEEALFYLRNCPNTEMDGDGDGDPCEQQFQ